MRPFPTERVRLLLGVVIGAITALLLVGLWLVRGGAGTADGEDRALAIGNAGDGGGHARSGTGPIIGAFQERVTDRLRATAPDVRRVDRLEIRARDLVWSEPGGRVFARAASASGVLDGGVVWRRDIVLNGVVLTEPRLMLREEAGGWNYEVVLAELLEDDSDDGDPEPLVLLRDARIERGFVEVTRADSTFTIEDIDARLPSIWLADPARPEPELRISTATATLDLPERDPIPLAFDDATVRLPEDVVAFAVEQLRIDGVQLTAVDGVWNPAWPFPGLDARGRALDVPLAELARYASERLPDEGSATFGWQVRPAEGDRVEVGVSDLRLETGGSHVRGEALFHIGGGSPAELRTADLMLDPLRLTLVESVMARPLPYGGHVTGRVRGESGDIAFDVIALLRSDTAPADSFTTSVNGRLVMGPAGVELRSAEAELRGVPLSSLRAFVPALPLGGTIDGTVSLTDTPDRVPLTLDLRFRTGLGLVTAGGTLDLTGEEPEYAVEGRIIGVELTEVLAPRAPPVAVTGRFSLDGRGIGPETADARFELAGRFTGWSSGPGDTVNVAATVRGGTLSLETLSLELATLSASASGDWRFTTSEGGETTPETGEIAYAFEIAELEAWAPYLPGPASGDAAGGVSLSGTVTGSLDEPRTRGQLEADGLELAGWRLTTARLQYAVAAGDSVPEVTIAGTGSGIETATAGGFETASVDVRLVAPQFDLTFEATRTGGGIVEVVADGTIPRSGAREVTLRTAVVDIEGGRWSLARPALIRSEGDEVVVSGFELIEAASGGRALLAGTVWPLRNVDVELDVARLPTGDVQRLLGFAPVVTGRLGMQGSIAVEEGAPVVVLAVHLDSGAVRGVLVPTLVGAVRYADGLIEARALAALDTAGRVAMELELPAEASVDSTPSFRLLPDGEVSGRLVAQDLALAPFAELSPHLRDLEGRANGEVGLTGTVAEPQWGGRMAVAGAAATVVPVNQRYTRIAADLELDGRLLSVRQLEAYSGGPLTASGQIVFETLREPVADMTVRLQGFRALGVDNQEDAAFAGSLTVTGPLPGAVIAGNLSVSDGYVPIPAPTGPEADFAALDVGEVGVETSWTDAILIDELVINVAQDVWFSGEGVRAQLRGELTTSKQGDAIRIQGTLEGERGTYTLRAGPIVRQFEIAHAQVRFLGSPDLDPALDITARRIVLDPSGQRLQIEVNVGGTLGNPTLSLASADLATVPESELLSFLFFGRPSFELGRGGLPGDVILQESVTELVGLELERVLVQDLGLSFDVFRIRFGGTGEFEGYGADVVLGWELGSEFFLTVESGLAALYGGDAGPPNTWAVRLDWAFDEASQARVGLEPYRLNRWYLRGLNFGLESQAQQQLFLEVRRRWTY